MNENSNLPALHKVMPSPIGIEVKEGASYKFYYGGDYKDIRVLKIRVHPDYPATYQVIFQSLQGIKKWKRLWSTQQMELSQFVKCLPDYNKVDRVIINPTVINDNGAI